LDEIVPSLLEGKGDPQGGFTSFFLCKRILFFQRLQEAIEEIKSIDPQIIELLANFEHAFQDYAGDEDEFDGDHQIDEGDEIESDDESDKK
jgi:hypothetical protein